MAYTTRVGDLLDAMDRSAARPDAACRRPSAGGVVPPEGADAGSDAPSLSQRLLASAPGAAHATPAMGLRDAAGGTGLGCAPAEPMGQGGGRCIRAVDLEVALPDGQTLMSGLNFAVEAGDFLLITGPSGCGKTSLLRVLKGLWPVRKGQLRTPPAGDVCFVPQRALLPSHCSLRGLITYSAGHRSRCSPCARREDDECQCGDGPAGQCACAHGQRARGKRDCLRLLTCGGARLCPPEPCISPQCPSAHALGPCSDRKQGDAALSDIAAKLHLDAVVRRVGGWDLVVVDWQDVLSSCEAQRVCVARALWCRAAFVILDEATSCMDLQMERRTYDALRATGAGVISVGHRPSLWRYHTEVLDMGLAVAAVQRLRSASDFASQSP